MDNLGLQQYFLDMIKEFDISNSTKEIDYNFIYSSLIFFNIRIDQMPSQNITNLWNHWLEKYKNNERLELLTSPKYPGFLWFFNGKTKGNEIKLYVPLDINHIEKGADLLFDFISEKNIQHQSKIANKIRNDNIVIRVDKIEDANMIIDFVRGNQYIKEGLIKTNPFLPSSSGVGIAMDNNFSYNSIVSKTISEFYNILKEKNDLDLFTVDELNKYIIKSSNNIIDQDLKDIYSLFEKITNPTYTFNELNSYIKNKILDEYDNNRKRITDPSYYLENAVKLTSKKYPQNLEIAILDYLKGNPKYFTNYNHARSSLLKYVKPGDLINIMRSKLISNNVEIPNNDENLIKNYLNIIFNKNQLKDFDIIKKAYLETLNKYSIDQARYALAVAINEKGTKYFTNKDSARDNLKKMILEGKNITKIILQNIDVNNLNVDNIDEVINRFESSILNFEKEKVMQ